MVAILAITLSLAGQFYTEDIKVPLPHFPKSVVAEVKGEFSNAADPCLSSPIKFTLLAQNYTQHYSLRGDCRIGHALSLDGNDVHIKLWHSHDIYDNYVDFIGKIEYKVFADDEVISGTYEFKQTPHLEKIKLLAPPEVKEKQVWAPFDNETHPYIQNYIITVIPYRRYRLEFEYYIVEEGNCYHPTFTICQLVDRGQYFRDKIDRVFHILKKNIDFNKRQRWAKFSKLIQADSFSVELQYNWHMEIKKDKEENWAGAIYIKNAVLIPLDNPKVKNGP